MMIRTFTEFSILQAFHGDSILVKTFDTNSKEFIILIDGGTAQTFKYSLKDELKSISHINILILTHIDSDHIAGLIGLFKSSFIDNITIDEIWINHPDLIEVNSGEMISVKQGENLKNLILEKKPDVKLSQISTSNKTISLSGIKFTFLSPTPEIVKELYDRWESLKGLDNQKNKSNISSEEIFYNQSLEDLSRIPFSPTNSIVDDIYNASSISFLLTCPDLSLLLLADSRAEVIENNLRELEITESNPLIVDYFKVSHHGSSNNTSQNLLSLIKCNDYLISLSVACPPTGHLFYHK